jgi:preprotein translocase subunit SecA
MLGDTVLMRELERYLLLDIIDQRWREHLHDLEYLREGIGLRGLAQLDPLVAYKNEAFTLFDDLMKTIWYDFARNLYHVQVTIQDMPTPQQMPSPLKPSSPSSSASNSTAAGSVRYHGGALPMGAQALAAAATGVGVAGAQALADGASAEPAAPVAQRRVAGDEPGRNDPCWCGSGKKYKRCHGA